MVRTLSLSLSRKQLKLERKKKITTKMYCLILTSINILESSFLYPGGVTALWYVSHIYILLTFSHKPEYNIAGGEGSLKAQLQVPRIHLFGFSIDFSLYLLPEEITHVLIQILWDLVYHLQN